MNENRPTFWEHLAREVSGNASEESKAWAQQQPEPELNEARTQAERVWKNTSLPTDSYEPDVERGWQRFQLKVQAREISLTLVKKNNTGVIRWAVAATISLLMVASAYFLTRPTQPAWTEIRTAANETKTIRLADGSTVALNQKSVFSYPTNFQKENRIVKLTGEAFFEVAKAEGKRFTIYAEGTKTEVIGTSFNLRAYAHEPVKVQVVTGKVAFARTETDDAIFLVPGQEGVIGEKTTVAQKQIIQNENFRSWETKNLTFSNMQLDQLAAELESYFNIKITIQNQALLQCRFTTSFRNPDLKEVLDILAVTGNLTITQKGTEYFITGPGCN
ncbi:FecR family protein [Adhaeribacter radiodurans]|uniref:FecR domain-containing protein n=1 Tax=Adhaeribacter radiodurans TaxID=2745197 RepID=A0A7L7L6L4_9BACT|nr:FecR domain-containing protein [Adhaeribacter radiodurans]QMU27999.1 FecR domain-containing protein [Adhaeribacter radiodurans]